MDFPNATDSWLIHLQNMCLTTKARAYSENEYLHHHDVEVYNKKYIDSQSISEISTKGKKLKVTCPAVKRTRKKMLRITFQY